MNTIKRYRKREPIEVEAVRVASRDIEAIAAWCQGRVLRLDRAVTMTTTDLASDVKLFQGIKLLTKNRLQVAEIGHYIYKDHEGYFHVVEQGPFNFEYEEIKENNG